MLVFMYSTGCYSCPILTKLEFCRQLSKKTQISNFMKILPLGAEVFHADRQTDMTKLIVAFRNFANAPKHRTSRCTNRNNFILHSSTFSSVPGVYRRPVRWSMSRISSI
jgi:hypothetical protein